MHLDNDQLAVCNTDCNAVISAGAGSGKTTVLAERYIRLIIDKGLDVSEVLTLTFTRKATTEMYARIYKRLSESKHPRAAEQILHFDQARISTLDSFCSSIVKGAAYRFGISGDFRVDDREIKISAKEIALALVMQHRHTKSIRTLVASRSFEDVVENLFAGIGINVCSLVRKGSFAAKAAQQIAFLESNMQTVLKQMKGLCRTIISVDDKYCTNDSSKKIKEAILKIYPLPPENSSPETLLETARLLTYSELYDLRGVVKITIEELQELKEAAINLKKQAAPRLKTLASMLRFKDDMNSVGAVLDEYETMFLSGKRQKAVLSFHDLTELAIEILKNDLALRNYYKQHIKAVMIDEFQDNNILQKELLYLIAERADTGVAGVQPGAADIDGEKLFFVGDEKQSIYRFRGADVSVFRSLSHEMNNSLSLSTNYRSAPELTAFYNALFPHVFGKPTKDFEAAFSEMKWPSEKSPSPNKIPVEIYIQEIDKDEEQDEESEEGLSGAKESEALEVALRIYKGVYENEFALGDVAVLFRKTTHQNIYERLFRRIGIPFDAADPRGIFAEGPVNDFYAILRLSLFPQDRSLYATVLRSPFVNLSDGAFFKIMLSDSNEAFPCNIDMNCFDSLKDRARYMQGLNTFNELKSMLDMNGIAPVVAYLWYKTGYRTFLLHNKKERHNSAHFEYIYTLALDADSRRMNTASFLDELFPLIGTTDKVDGGQVPEESDKVRFLTVHKSKGLEFKVVIIANAGYKGKSESNDMPYYVDKEYGVSINFKMDTEKRDESVNNYFYDMHKELSDSQQQAELKRLFYVAATRAKEKLFIFSSCKLTKAMEKEVADLSGEERLKKIISTPRLYKDSAKKGIRHADTFFDLLTFCFAQGDLPYCKVLGFSSFTLSMQEQCIQKMHRYFAKLSGEDCEQSIDRFYDLPILERVGRPSIKVINPSALDSAYGEVEEVLPEFGCEHILEDSLEDKSGHSKFGTLCHAAIEGIIERGAGIEEELVKMALSLFGEKYFLEKKLHKLPYDAPLLAQEAFRVAQDFIKSPLGRELREASKFTSEFKFLLPLSSYGTKEPSFLIEGSMDLIYEYKGACVIVDFKVDRKKVRGAHLMQMACYKAAAGAFSDCDVEANIVYLRNMEVVPVRETFSDYELYNMLSAAAGPA